MEQLSEFIQKSRKAQGLSRATVCLHSGVGKTTLFDLENNKQSVGLDKFLQVANTLGIQITLENATGEQFTLEAE